MLYVAEHPKMGKQFLSQNIDDLQWTLGGQNHEETFDGTSLSQLRKSAIWGVAGWNPALGGAGMNAIL